VSAAILGMGVVAPGAAGVNALRAKLREPPTGDYRVARIGDEENLRFRRLPRIDRMALSAAREALGSHDPSNVALVYGTGYGGLTATVDFLEGVAARGSEFGSPTSFHQSVHHAAAGQISIALGMRAIALTTSSREISGEAALKVGVDLIRSGRAEKVLVVAADEAVPALANAYAAFGVLGAEGTVMTPGQRALRPGEGAAAILLGRTGSPFRVVDVFLAGHRATGLRFANDALALEPLLRRAAQASGESKTRVLAGATGTEPEGAELAAFAATMPSAQVDHPVSHFGFNPSGGLLRAVVAAIRLADEEDSVQVVHGLALGGGQACGVLSRA
jgi:3-oxoacyl-[acyl-carrier-protein] synthase II